MALIINNFWGAETGGLEELSASSGGNASSIVVKTGNYSYLLSSAPSNHNFAPFESVADAGGKYIVKFDFNLTSVGSASHAVGFFQLAEGAAPFLELAVHDTSNDLLILDATGSTIRTITQPFTADEWIELILVFEHSASGTVELFIDGVSQGEDTAQDLTDGGTFDTITFRRTTINVAPYNYDNIVFQSGATAASDRLGGCEVIAYRSTLASVTPDWAQTASLALSALEAGQWADTQEIPFSETNVGSYNDATLRAGGVDTNDSGGSAGTGGPNTDANIDGDSNIKAMKGVWRLQRSGGGATAQLVALSNSGEATTDAQVDSSGDLDITTGYVNYFLVVEGSFTPTSSEYGRIGLNKSTGGQDLDCSDMLFQVLHVPNVGGNASLLSKFNRNFRHMMVR